MQYSIAWCFPNQSCLTRTQLRMVRIVSTHCYALPLFLSTRLCCPSITAASSSSLAITLRHSPLRYCHSDLNSVDQIDTCSYKHKADTPSYCTPLAKPHYAYTCAISFLADLSPALVKRSLHLRSVSAIPMLTPNLTTLLTCWMAVALSLLPTAHPL